MGDAGRGPVRRRRTARHVPKNIITRSLGPNPGPGRPGRPVPVQAGDTFLLCSDGLSGQVGDEEIGTILQCLPPEDAVRALVDLANLRGGPDNITAVAVRVLGPQSPKPSAAAVGAVPSRRRPRVGVDDLWLTGLAAAGPSPPWRRRHSSGAAVPSRLGRTGTLSPRCRPTTRLLESRHFGRGPYVASCLFAERRFLRAAGGVLTTPFRDSAAKEARRSIGCHSSDFSVDADSAKQLGNVADAIQADLKAMSFMMAQCCELAKLGHHEAHRLQLRLDRVGHVAKLFGRVRVD